MRKKAVTIFLAALFFCCHFAGAGQAQEKTYTSSIGMEFVLIPSGSFTMGSPKSEEGRDDDEIQHEVVISKPFLAAKYEVTQGIWKKVMGKNPSHYKECGEDCPVEKVTWLDAVKFCNRLSEKEGLEPAYRIIQTIVTWNQSAKGYRLPTEAEWEYACRAGTTTKYCTGDSDADLGRAGWYSENAESKTHPVGKKAPNTWGIYDVHGNVSEWCWDRYGKDYYANSLATNPTGSLKGSDRVIRGGGWFFGYARYCRSANRGEGNPDASNGNLGFRLVRSK